MTLYFFLRGKGEFPISVKELRVVIAGTRKYLKGGCTVNKNIEMTESCVSHLMKIKSRRGIGRENE